MIPNGTTETSIPIQPHQAAAFTKRFRQIDALHDEINELTTFLGVKPPFRVQRLDGDSQNPILVILVPMEVVAPPAPPT